MTRRDILDVETRTRIASLLYKLAIRVMKISKRPLDVERTVMALNHSRKNLVKSLVQRLTAPLARTAPSVQKVLATRTVAPGQGDGIRIDLLLGPVQLLERDGDLGVVTSKTVREPGQPPRGLSSLEELNNALSAVFGGALPQVKLITEDVRDVSDRPFRIDHGYDKDLGTRAWRIVHNGGPKDGQVAIYEDPKILAQMETNSDLDPYRPAVFKSAEEASLVLNQLTRGTSLSSRNFPKFREYTVYFKYSAVYLQSEGTLYNIFDRLLTEADQAAEERNRLSHQEKKDLIEKAVLWIKEKEVSPDALLSTLQAKDPDLAKKFKEVLPDVVDRLQEVA